MDSTDSLLTRPLQTSDIPDLMALVEEAGWNQTEGDWQRMLAIGDGLGLCDDNGRVVASAVTLPYGGRVGWIGMVLVAGHWRRRGIATGLIGSCVKTLRAGGHIPGLDATPAGEAVYEKMGFHGAMVITRWRRERRGDRRTPRTARPVTDADLPWITGLDARAFGADRQGLIAAMTRIGQADAGWTRDRTAFLLHRPGRTARQIGPLCATDPPAALDLLSKAIDGTDAALIVDAPDHQSDVAELLDQRGFTRERPFRRMYHGATGPRGDASCLYAIAGPELG